MLTNFEDTKTTYNRMQISSLITRAPIPRELDSPDNTEIKSHSYRSRLKEFVMKSPVEMEEAGDNRGRRKN